MLKLSNFRQLCQKDNFKVFCEGVALLFILSLASYLRLTNIGINPGWYTDEGTHLDIAQNLLQGRVQYLAINQSTLLFAKLPLFEMLLATLLGLFGGGMATLRTFTGILGVISVGVLYWVVRRTHKGEDNILALLAAFMLAIYPQAILYSRFGFSYNLLVPLVLLTYWGFWEYLQVTSQETKKRRTQQKYLAFSALMIGLGGLGDLWMFTLVAPLILLVSTRTWIDLLLSFPLVLLPFGLYALIMLMIAPHAFLFDLDYIFFELNKLSWSAQISTLALNYTTLLSQSFWMVVAIGGLFMLRPARLKYLSLLLFFAPLIILGRTVALFNLSFYYMIPLLPFIALGVASAVRHSTPYLFNSIYRALLILFSQWGFLLQGTKIKEKLLMFGTVFIFLFIIATPFLMTLISSINQVQVGFKTEIDIFLTKPQEAQQATQFVNEHLDVGDMVIASPTLAWLIQGNVADFQMSTATTGEQTVHLPANIPADRFAFEAHYTHAKFVVVDSLWHNWAVWVVAGVADMMQDLEDWPIVFKAGEVVVYCNPERAVISQCSDF